MANMMSLMDTNITIDANLMTEAFFKERYRALSELTLELSDTPCSTYEGGAWYTFFKENQNELRRFLSTFTATDFEIESVKKLVRTMEKSVKGFNVPIRYVHFAVTLKYMILYALVYIYDRTDSEIVRNTCQDTAYRVNEIIKF